MSQITHTPDENGILRQVVSPEELRRILDEDGETYDKPDHFGNEDEWDIDLATGGLTTEEMKMKVHTIHTIEAINKKPVLQLINSRFSQRYLKTSVGRGVIITMRDGIFFVNAIFKTPAEASRYANGEELVGMINEDGLPVF